MVKAGGQVIYSPTSRTRTSDRLFPGGCGDGSGRAKCTEGWSGSRRSAAGSTTPTTWSCATGPASTSTATARRPRRHRWEPGVLVEYTDEARGYGNNGTPEPPRQHYLDSQPIPGSDCGDNAERQLRRRLVHRRAPATATSDDAGDADLAGRLRSTTSTIPTRYGDGLWHFDYGCLTLDVTSMTGEGDGPEHPSDLTANATITAGAGCAPFTYGAAAAREPAPTAAA